MWIKFSTNLKSVDPVGLSNILKYTCVNKNEKKKGVFFAVKLVKQGTSLGV